MDENLVNIGTDPVRCVINLTEKKIDLLEKRTSLNKQIAWLDSIISLIEDSTNKKKKK